MADISKNINKCIKRRERIFVRLQLCYDLIKELPAKKNVFATRCSELTQLYSDFEEVSQEIDDLNEKLVDPKDVTDTSAPSKQFDIMYYEIKSAYELILVQENLVAKANVRDEIIVKPKLPQIDISKFGGQLEQFSSFKSLFDNLIHSSSIAPIEKFSYLKSLLEGPALSVIEGIPFDPEHYQLAYTTLVERYTNPRILACHYLNKILDQPPIKSPSLSNLRQLIDVFHINVQALKTLNVQDLSGFVFMQLVLRLLDNNTRKAFELENKAVQFPTLATVIDFLRAQCSVYELTTDSAKHVFTNKSITHSPRKAFMTTQPRSDKNQSTSSQPLQYTLTCPMCKCNHQLYRCEQFTSLKPAERYNTVRSLKRCFACLGSHMLSTCSSNSSCKHCRSKTHHSLLHIDKSPKPFSSQTSSEPGLGTSPSIPNTTLPSLSEKPAQSLSCSLNRKSSNNLVILSTAQVIIKDSLGNWQKCRLVIDGGSEVNFITRSMAQSLNLPLEKCSVDVIGIGHSSNITAKNVVSCKIASRYNQSDVLRLDAIVIPQIASDLPATPLPESLKKKFSSLLLADTDFHRPSKVDMLLGAQAFTDILTDGFSFIKGQPSALHTIFGWVLMGNVPSEQPYHKQTNSLFVSLKTDQLLQKFWELEEINFPKPCSSEDQACEDHYSSTIERDETGRYVASLPFKDCQPPDLGSTREVALRKYRSLESRFERNSDLKDKYNCNLQDYVEQGHMVIATNPSSYILTHHGVMKESSTSSPLRVVFNASELSDTNQSLNKALMIGPKLQSDIGTIITTFRLHRIALACDIKQMYRAIRLSKEDCKYQHLLWRSDTSGPVQEWELQRLTFGVSSSPFIAQRTLKQLVMDEGSKFPRAADALSNSCYIDDLVCGAPSITQAVELYRELTQLLKSGGFELHKYTSSSTEVLQNIPESHRETPHSLGLTTSIKILGLEWDPSTDCFRYAISPLNHLPTKRNVLSQVARIYDINGYISPIVFTLKHLLQEIWINKLDWDDNLPPQLEDKWNKFIHELPLISQLSIPRYILSTYVSAQLIGFSDASKSGMCASLYLRVVCNDKNIDCNLIQSKTKVAPLKPLTIPRLELCAALLLSRLVKANQQIISALNITDICLFSDSMNVLCWIHTSPHQLETFVSNRVCQILENTQVGSWNHIAGNQNPADCGTRGLMPSKLINLSIWWHGPPFLLNDESTWPINSKNFIQDFPAEESTTPFTALSTAMTSHTLLKNDLYDWMNRYSTLIKLQNVMGYVRRFIHNIRHKPQKLIGPLSPLERHEALKTCIKIVQQHHYSTEFRLLKQGRECSPSLRTLSPFLSKDTLMVGGRLRYAPIPETAKHPLLLPAQSYLAALLCDHYHLYSLHGGPKLVQSLIQRHYWIPGARNLIRKRIFKCLPCYKLKAQPIQPYMADIPPSRFHQGRCFEQVGLDFAGPFLVKESTRRNARLSKCYIALFVCMVVKAIHLELVHDLTTDSCLAAIDRFIARRGLPKTIFSDQGRNFVGAARQLQEVYELLKNSNNNFSDHLAKQHVTWTFNPPYAANFGGLWEAGVKSTKHHLKRILDTHHFTAEEFSTFLCRIEAVLNSRPLCPLSTSPDDGFDHLTPGHFLVGGPLLSRPEEDVTAEPLHLLTRWKLISRASHMFWKNWSREYVHSQIQRPKWTTKIPNVNEGDLVLMYSPNTPPLSWPLGRIIKTLPGNDNVVRVVQVKTSQGSFTRPVNKLVALPRF